MEIKVKNSQNKSIINLKGAIDYKSLEKLKTQLIESLSFKAIDLDLTHIKEFNFSFVQLFCSLIKTVETRKIQFRFIHKKADIFDMIMTHYGVDISDFLPYCEHCEGQPNE